MSNVTTTSDIRLDGLPIPAGVDIPPTEVITQNPQHIFADEDNFNDNFDDNLLPKVTDHKGRQFNILEASENGKLQLIQRLIQMDVNQLNVKDSDGYTPLHRACYNNRVEVVKWLIQQGANVCARTKDGWEPIHSAAQWGHANLVRILIAAGADVNSRTNGGNTPFHLAVTRGVKNHKLIEYLLFHDDVDLEVKNNANDTPFDICKRNSMLYRLWELL